MYGNQHGQIIGLKMREREAEDRQRHLKERIRDVVDVLQRYETALEPPPGLVHWAAEQLAGALSGARMEPFRPSGPVKATSNDGKLDADD